MLSLNKKEQNVPKSRGYITNCEYEIYIYIYTSAVKGHCGSQKPDPQLIFGQSGKYHIEVILE